jgi:Ca-activated chloride channel family protein
MGACITLVVALAGPTWGSEVIQPVSGRTAVMFILDVSRSMDVEDAQPSRLERAKQTLIRVLPLLKGTDVGLIIFAGASEMVFPLTSDVFLTATRVASITTSSITEQGSQLSGALAQAMSALSVPVIGQGSIVLLSDGEFAQNDFDSIIVESENRGIPIFVFGYGTKQGDLIPDQDESGNPIYRVDAAGQPIISRLNEAELQRIANLSNGQYLRVGTNDQEIGIINELISHSHLSNNSLVELKSQQNAPFVTIALLILIVTVTRNRANTQDIRQ